MGTDSRVLTSSPPLVALAAWLLPGGGYLLIGQRGRGLVTGITIIALFISGLLIGGVRVIEVPGYEIATGEKQMVTITAPAVNQVTHQAYVDRNGNPLVQPIMVPMLDPKTNQPVVDSVTGTPKMQPLKRWSLLVTPLNEIREKPWSVPQVLTGPLAVFAGALSVYAAGPADGGSAQALGALTHARINELGSLYLSVAGLLNLMVIIDAAWRASHMPGQLLEQKDTA